MAKTEHTLLAANLQKLGGHLHNRTLELSLHETQGEALQKLKALASEPRLRILRYLTHPNKLSNLTGISEALEMNIATVTMHVNILEEAGLILCEHIPGERGTQRVCGCFVDYISLHMSRKPLTDAGNMLEYSVPIGSYVSFDVAPTCGLFSETEQIGIYDDPLSFHEAARVHAQLLWFHSGFVEYHLPHRLAPDTVLESLSISLEACSEAPTYHNDWPSDITLWLNDVELGSWTSPADFGGSRGKLTPAWQPTHATQYGLLKTWQVTREETLLEGVKLSDVSLGDLGVLETPLLRLRVGVKADAEHVGGVNLFGARFGNHPQDIVLRLWHQ